MSNSNGETVALSDQQFLRFSVNLLLRVAIVFSVILKQNIFVFLLSQQPPVGHGLLILEVSRFTLNDAPQSVDSSGRVISPSQRPLPHNTQQSQQTDIHAPGGIRNHDPIRRAAVDPRLRPRGHWVRLPQFTIV